MPAAWVADEFCAPIIPVVMELHGQGLSLRAIWQRHDLTVEVEPKSKETAVLKLKKNLKQRRKPKKVRDKA